MVGDRVISPVYDDLPGVYLHAMAYDNLVTFGSTYKRADHHGLSLSSVVNGLLLLFTVVLLLLVDKPPAPSPGPCSAGSPPSARGSSGWRWASPCC